MANETTDPDSVRLSTEETNVSTPSNPKQTTTSSAPTMAKEIANLDYVQRAPEDSPIACSKSNSASTVITFDAAELSLDVQRI